MGTFGLYKVQHVLKPNQVDNSSTYGEGEKSWSKIKVEKVTLLI